MPHTASDDKETAASGASLFVTAQDGLRLHVRSYGERTAPGLPVMCLPGLTRTAEDFHALAETLASDPARPRRAIALDYRGRGRSGYDRPRNYNLAVELMDVVAVLTALAIGRAVFVGTSRGGILTMLLAAVRPGAIAGVVLNDIGPVIEPQGLMRLKSYVGKLPQPRSFEEAAELMRRLFEPQFPKLPQEQWLAFAHQTWKEEKGRLKLTYDARLAKTLDGMDLERSLPALWNQFDALERVPILAIRGANSDILSAQTLAAMRARHAGLETVEVADQGHAPLLAGPELLGRIAAFAAGCEPARPSDTESG